MAKIKILVEGYADKNRSVASSTTTLIQENGQNIIVDPGIDRQKLTYALIENDLSPDDINFVVITHYHVDHCALAGIFEKAIIIDDSEWSDFTGSYSKSDGKIPGTEIEIIKTPGHDQFHCVVALTDENDKKYVVAGDVFWFGDNEEVKTDSQSLLERHDPYTKNESDLKASRQKILEIAHYIIPGHGKIIEVKK